MNATGTSHPLPPLPVRSILIWVGVAVTAFATAYLHPALSPLIALYVYALMQLGRATTWRKAFYPGLAAGMGVAAMHLDFFWRIFGAGAIALWIVFAIWIALFVLLCWHVLRQLGSGWAAVVCPFLWIGLEFFRSELYYLRFAWCSPGMAFASLPQMVPYSWLGTYGVGFLLVLVCGLAAYVFQRRWWHSAIVLFAGVGVLLGLGFLETPPLGPLASAKAVRVAGVQMEFPSDAEIMIRLNELIRKFPEAELLVLSEYTLAGEPGRELRNWCHQKQRYLIVGGKDESPGKDFYNTAYVISPEGKIVFQQCKTVPIQFFKDGLPARDQKLWNSPWGKIGICICYDLSYSKVTDSLVSQGAEALIVPTMDVADWGQRQHRLHARIAPLRAAEYRLPIFRVASSGISQLVGRAGEVTASAPFPGEGASVTGKLELAGPGHLPWDRFLARVGVIVTLLTMLGLVANRMRETRFSREQKTFVEQKPQPVHH